MIIAAAILPLIAGLLHGLREAFHADRKLFEDRFKVQPVSFFGSKQDTMKYKSKGVYKSLLWKYFPLDFWHSARWLENAAVAGAVWSLTGLWYTFPAYLILVGSGGHFSYFMARKNTKK